eukprot:CAMPEP_0198207578 /NCGR_PEP_ID=MMETSP1445-20131203/11008_1 /TAXON_ID=36898 /ORGANISM="Pyramimonas sp., Strain CCMP2087" /LENGTH=894 /DNA_ID=CAMNT_0043880657 /DNA_START=289 /DNA_END=2973 /DNA_ORIENTATION=-
MQAETKFTPQRTSSSGGTEEKSRPPPLKYGVNIDAQAAFSKSAKACRVPDCPHADLRSGPRYCRSHRICEYHIKCLHVYFNDAAYRFCQKCTRFHVVEEFEEEKHTCRQGLLLQRKQRLMRSLTARGLASGINDGDPVASLVDSVPSSYTYGGKSGEDCVSFSSLKETMSFQDADKKVVTHPTSPQVHVPPACVPQGAPPAPALDVTLHEDGVQTAFTWEQNFEGPNSWMEMKHDVEVSSMFLDENTMSTNLERDDFMSFSPDCNRRPPTTAQAVEAPSFSHVQNEFPASDSFFTAFAPESAPFAFPSSSQHFAQNEGQGSPAHAPSTTLQDDPMDGTEQHLIEPAVLFEQEEKSALILQMKFSGSTPTELPADMRERFLTWFQEAPSWLSTYIQPGCVELTVAALLPAQQYDRLKEQGVERLVDVFLNGPNSEFFKASEWLAVAFGDRVEVQHGRIVQKESLPLAGGISFGGRAWVDSSFLSSAAPGVVSVHGRLPPCTQLACFQNGVSCPLTVLERTYGDDADRISFMIPTPLLDGILLLEVRQEQTKVCFPILLCPGERFVGEVRQYEDKVYEDKVFQAPLALLGLLADLAVVLESTSSVPAQADLYDKLLRLCASMDWPAIAEHVLNRLAQQASADIQLVVQRLVQTGTIRKCLDLQLEDETLISSLQNLGIVCSPTYVSTNNVQGVCAFFDRSSAEPVTAVHVQPKLKAAVSFARSLLRSNREQGFLMFDISIQHSITIVQSLREEASNQVAALRTPDHLEESTLALAESIFRDLLQSVQGDASPFHPDLEGRIALVGALYEAVDSTIGLRRRLSLDTGRASETKSAGTLLIPYTRSYGAHLTAAEGSRRNSSRASGTDRMFFLFSMLVAFVLRLASSVVHSTQTAFLA